MKGLSPTGSRPFPTAAVAALLSLAVIVVYNPLGSPIWTYSFINYDDPLFVGGASHVRDGLSPGNVLWAFGPATRLSNYWAPLVWLSFMADAQVYGAWPGGFHITNVLLHALNAALLFLALTRLTKSPWTSAFAAALFALHPLRVESVAWVTERKDVLGALFWMLTLLLYARYAEKPGRLRYAAVLAGFFLGLAAKPMMVTLPCALLILDWWPLGRLKGRASLFRLVLEKIPFFILSGIISLVTWQTQATAGALVGLSTVPLSVRLLNVVSAYAFYIEKTFWPANLCILYPYPHHPPVFKALISLGIIASITALALIRARRRPYLAAGWLWYLGTLFPVAGLVIIGPHSVADRYSYIPSIGIAVMLAFGLADLARRLSPRPFLVFAGAAAVLAAFSAASARQLPYWKNSVSLYTRTLAVTRDNWVIATDLGSALMDRGDYAGALARFRQAAAIRPDVAEARENEGRALLALSRPREALKSFEAALSLDPRRSGVYISLGLAWEALGDRARSFACFRQAVVLAPGSAVAHHEYGVALADSGRPADAEREYREALRLKPRFPEARVNLGIALAAQGRLQESLAEFREALAEDPQNADARAAIAQLTGKKT